MQIATPTGTCCSATWCTRISTSVAHFRAFAQLKSGLEDGRTGGPRPSDEDRLDLHQAFGEAMVGAARRQLSLRAGRQEVAFGSSRLVSVREGPNVRRSFDGVRATVAARSWQLDGIGLASAKTGARRVRRRDRSRRTTVGRLRVRAVARRRARTRSLLACAAPRRRRVRPGHAQRAAPLDRHTHLGCAGRVGLQLRARLPVGLVRSGRHRGVDRCLGYRLHVRGAPDAAAPGPARQRHERRSQTRRVPTSRRSIRCFRAAPTSARRA